MLLDKQQSQSAEQHVLILCVTDLNWLLAGTSTANYGHPKDSTVYISAQGQQLQNRSLFSGWQVLTVC